MSQAIIDLYANGEAAAVRAHALSTAGWLVVVSGPNTDGTDLHQEGANPPETFPGGWVVLASQDAITPV